MSSTFDRAVLVPWCEWCFKPRGVEPRLGGCPCPKSQAEAQQRWVAVQARHAESVKLAASTAPTSPLTATDTGTWLRSTTGTCVHLFPRGFGLSHCGRVTRPLRAKPAGEGDRPCKTCQRAAGLAEEESS